MAKKKTTTPRKKSAKKADKKTPARTKSTKVKKDCKKTAKVQKRTFKETSKCVIEDKRSGILSTIKNLLEQIPPEFRQKVVENFKNHGPDAALAVVFALERKVKNPKAKMALKAMAVILGALAKEKR